MLTAEKAIDGLPERGGYKSSISGCPGSEAACRHIIDGTPSMAIGRAIVPAFVLFFVLGHRYGVNTG
jgi:hypothetical protein